MNRFHVHLNVADLAASIDFYTQLFAAPPSVVKDDYAKWMLADPRVNFAISNMGRAPGIDHLGFQVESEGDLAEIGRRLDVAGSTVVPEQGAVCCYARSDKLWTHDPQGTRWESFRTIGEATTYHGHEAACAAADANCGPGTGSIKPNMEREASCCSPRSACC